MSSSSLNPAPVVPASRPIKDQETLFREYVLNAVERSAGFNESLHKDEVLKGASIAIAKALEYSRMPCSLISFR